MTPFGPERPRLSPTKLASNRACAASRDGCREFQDKLRARYGGGEAWCPVAAGSSSQPTVVCAAPVQLPHHPSVREQAWRINLQIFARDFECSAVRTDSRTAPLAPRANLCFKFSTAIDTGLTPPRWHLPGFDDRLKHALGGDSNPDLADDGVRIGHDDGRAHPCSSPLKTGAHVFRL